MRFRIVVVGKVRQPFVRDAEAEYGKRLRGYAELDVVEVTTKVAGSAPDDVVRAREADELLSRIPTGERLVALDGRGRSLSSADFAAWLGDQQRRGTSRVTFVVGGASGLDERIRARADLVLSLSAMTLPHQIARLVLVEQIYRACTILRGEPYHK
jgi:23S rRNA (pseudouridine1915-N3)-methyltransferase